MRLKNPRRKATAEYELGYLYGELTERLATLKLSGIIPSGRELKDGHDPFETPNFKRHEGMLPKNLDILEVDLRTGNLEGIYEVKSTTTDRKEFNSNGQCSIFMQKAKDDGIPIYLIVVRLDRETDPNVLRQNPQTNEIELNHEVYEKEAAHFLQNARFELYTHDKFKLENGKFIIEGESQII